MTKTSIEHGRAIIEAFGGATAVSRLIEAPVSTVWAWTQNGIPTSRVAHLRLVAKSEGIVLPNLERKAEPPQAPAEGRAA